MPDLVARLGSGSPHVAFFGHVDVGPPGEGWTVDPFAGELRGGVLYGRGACDMKGAIACFIAAVARFCEARPHGFPGTISVLLTGDEEHDGVGGAARLLPHLAALGGARTSASSASPRRRGRQVTRSRSVAAVECAGRFGCAACRATAPTPIEPTTISRA
ncbi:M20/M25/M40 family metallo-hydrolase [Nannocystis pusilla]|uniref:M20/M25/M40 family metallo-hydrolase n=1 Tax=Nannocystis pusilla TaxID=889268 RepID=UPI003B831A64